jgi:hypothetical protein
LNSNPCLTFQCATTLITSISRGRTPAKNLLSVRKSRPPSSGMIKKKPSLGCIYRLLVVKCSQIVVPHKWQKKYNAQGR